MRYVKNIDKQYRLWILNLERIIKNHAVKFAEDEKNKDMNLKLRKQIFNILLKRRFVRRLLKINVSKNVLTSDAFMIDVSFESTDISKLIAVNFKLHLSNELKSQANNQDAQNASASSMFKSAAAQTFLYVTILKRKKNNED